MKQKRTFWQKYKDWNTPIIGAGLGAAVGGLPGAFFGAIGADTARLHLDKGYKRRRKEWFEKKYGKGYCR